jgi:hypothetical protein
MKILKYFPQINIAIRISNVSFKNGFNSYLNTGHSFKNTQITGWNMWERLVNNTSFNESKFILPHLCLMVPLCLEKVNTLPYSPPLSQWNMQWITSSCWLWGIMWNCSISSIFLYIFNTQKYMHFYPYVGIFLHKNSTR